jgi:HEPN domain-containing protein
METLTCAPPNRLDLVGGTNLIPNFFENYPPDWINAKLQSFCNVKMLADDAVAIDPVCNDLQFYTDLMELLYSLKNPSLYYPSCMIVPSFTEQTLVSVEGVVNLIKQAIPVGIIYNLGRSNEELDLIVVLERSCTRGYDEFESIIDLALLGYQKGTCTVHNYGLLNTLISKGHLFYATACIEANIVYQKSTDESFKPIASELVIAACATAHGLFKNGMEKATSFYDGAQHYLNEGENEMAVFMLQQACELTYRCLLNVLRGKDLKCHSPAILRKHLKRFAPEIIGIFSANESVELEYLSVLEDAYVKSRYHQDYKIGQSLICLLNEKVGLLQERSTALFADRILALAALAMDRI